MNLKGVYTAHEDAFLSEIKGLKPKNQDNNDDDNIDNNNNQASSEKETRIDNLDVYEIEDDLDEKVVNDNYTDLFMLGGTQEVKKSIKCLTKRKLENDNKRNKFKIPIDKIDKLNTSADSLSNKKEKVIDNELTKKTTLNWVVKLLDKHNIEFQFVGEIAAKAYSDSNVCNLKEIDMIDIYISGKDFLPACRLVKEYITTGPYVWNTDHWNCEYIKLNYLNHVIKFINSDENAENSELNTPERKWLREKIDYTHSVKMKLYDIEIPVIAKELLIEYNQKFSKGLIIQNTNINNTTNINNSHIHETTNKHDTNQFNKADQIFYLDDDRNIPLSYSKTGNSILLAEQSIPDDKKADVSLSIEEKLKKQQDRLNKAKNKATSILTKTNVTNIVNNVHNINKESKAQKTVSDNTLYSIDMKFKDKILRLERHMLSIYHIINNIILNHFH